MTVRNDMMQKLSLKLVWLTLIFAPNTLRIEKGTCRWLRKSWTRPRSDVIKVPLSIGKVVKMSAGRRSKRPIERILIFLFMQLKWKKLGFWKVVEAWWSYDPDSPFGITDVGFYSIRDDDHKCSGVWCKADKLLGESEISWPFCANWIVSHWWLNKVVMEALSTFSR